MYCFLEFRGIVGGNDIIFCIEQVPFAVSFVDSAENPAVAVKIGELSFCQLAIEFDAAGLLEKFPICPKAPRSCAFRVSEGNLISLFLSGIVLLTRIHRLGVGFIVPPRESKIGGLHVCSGMDMANHALA